MKMLLYENGLMVGRGFVCSALICVHYITSLHALLMLCSCISLTFLILFGLLQPYLTPSQSLLFLVESSFFLLLLLSYLSPLTFLFDSISQKLWVDYFILFGLIWLVRCIIFFLSYPSSTQCFSDSCCHLNHLWTKLFSILSMLVQTFLLYKEQNSWKLIQQL